jgi:hypothetical protein
MSFCFFVGVLGAAMAICMPGTGFDNYSLLLPRMLVLTSLFGETGLICAQPAADIASLFIGVVIYAMLMRKDGQAE